MGYTAATRIEHGHVGDDKKTVSKVTYNVGETIDESKFTPEDLSSLAASGAIITGDQKLSADQLASAQAMMSPGAKAQAEADKAAAEAKAAADKAKAHADAVKSAKPTAQEKADAEAAAKADAMVKAHFTKTTSQSPKS